MKRIITTVVLCVTLASPAYGLKATAETFHKVRKLQWARGISKGLVKDPSYTGINRLSKLDELSSSELRVFRDIIFGDEIGIEIRTLDQPNRNVFGGLTLEEWSAVRSMHSEEGAVLDAEQLALVSKFTEEDLIFAGRATVRDFFGYYAQRMITEELQSFEDMTDDRPIVTFIPQFTDR